MGVKRYALIDRDGHVVNVVLVDPNDIGTWWQPDDGLTPVQSDVVSPGDIYFDGKFYAVQEAADPTDDGDNRLEVYEIVGDGDGRRGAIPIPPDDERYAVVCEKFHRHH